MATRATLNIEERHRRKETAREWSNYAKKTRGLRGSRNWWRARARRLEAEIERLKGLVGLGEQHGNALQQAWDELLPARISLAAADALIAEIEIGAGDKRLAMFVRAYTVTRPQENENG